MPTPLGQITGELNDVREFTNGAGATITSSQKYTGAYSVSFTTGSAPATIAFPTQTNGIRLSAFIRPGSLYTNGAVIFRISNQSTTLAQVIWHPTSTNLELYVDGTLRTSVAPTTVNLSTGVWAHVGMIYIPSASKVNFYVNGNLALTYTGALSAQCDNVSFGGRNLATGGWTTCHMDDMYVDGDVIADEPPPPDRFYICGVTGPGAITQWLPQGQVDAYACIDEATPNDDTDYIYATAAAQKATFAIADFTLPAGNSIADVTVVALTKVAAAGPTLSFVAAAGANEQITTPQTPTTTYAYIKQVMPVAPDLNSWTEGGLNATEFGVQSAGNFT